MQRVPKNQEAAFSLIEVMVAVGITLLAALVISGAFASSFFQERVISSSKAFRDVEGGLRTALATLLSSKAAGGTCATAMSITGLAFGSGTFATATAIPNVQAASGNLPGNAAAHAAAATRCATRRSPGAAATVPAEHYFCMLYTPNAAAATLDGTSFDRSRDAFVEVRARLFDPRTGTDISCAQYAAAPLTSSIRVGYAIYWKATSSKRPGGAPTSTAGFIHNSKLGFFYAGQ